MTGGEGASFEVEEVFTEQGDLLVLSLGFASAENPLDILHIACGRSRTGREPRPVEDLLYLERTDQGLSCDGRDVIRIILHAGHIELALTAEGARALGLPERVLFRFDRHPALLPAARAVLGAMAAAGQRQVSV